MIHYLILLPNGDQVPAYGPLPREDETILYKGSRYHVTEVVHSAGEAPESGQSAPLVIAHLSASP